MKLIEFLSSHIADPSELKDLPSLAESYFSQAKSREEEEIGILLSYLSSLDPLFLHRLLQGHKRNELPQEIKKVASFFYERGIDPHFYAYILDCFLVALGHKKESLPFVSLRDLDFQAEHDPYGQQFGLGFSVIDPTVFDDDYIGTASANVCFPKGKDHLPPFYLADQEHLLFVSIPEGIVSLPEGFFQECSELRYVLLPSTLSEIPAYCFKNCEKLIAVSAPNLKVIGPGAFRGSGLKTLQGLHSENLAAVGAEAFADSGIALSELRLGDCRLGEHAFANVKNIETVSLIIGESFPEVLLSDVFENEDGVAVSHIRKVELELKNGLLPPGFFVGLESLEEIVLHGEVKELESGCFAHMDSLKRIELNYVGDTLPEDAFAECPKLETIAGLLECKNIAPRAFFGDASLRVLSLTKKVETLGEESFYQCESIESPILDFQGEEVPFACFAHCHALSRFTFSEKLRTIGESAFADCPNLRDFCHEDASGFDIAAIEDMNINAFDDIAGAEEIVVPETWMKQEGSLAIFPNLKRLCFAFSKESHPVTRLLGKTQYDNLEAIEATSLDGIIPEGFFAGLPALKRIAIKNEVQEVGASAFADDKSLASLRWLCFAEEVPYMCFDGCHRLVEPLHFSKAKKVGEKAFHACYELKEIHFDVPVESFGIASFAECPNLVKVEAEYLGSELPEECFLNDRALSSIPSLEHILILGRNCLSGCASLKAIAINQPSEGAPGFGTLFVDFAPETIIYRGKKVPDRYFASIPSLRQVTFSKDLEEIGAYAFENCSSLSSLSPLPSLKVLGDHAFAHTPLESITLGANLEELSLSAFAESNLRDIIFLPGSHYETQDGVLVDVTSKTAFYVLDKELEEVHFNEGVEELSEKLFANTKIKNFSGPSVKRVGLGLFEGCEKLGQIELPFLGLSETNPIPAKALFGAEFEIDGLIINGGALSPEFAFEGGKIGVLDLQKVALRELPILGKCEIGELKLPASLLSFNPLALQGVKYAKLTAGDGGALIIDDHFVYVGDTLVCCHSWDIPPKKGGIRFGENVHFFDPNAFPEGFCLNAMELQSKHLRNLPKLQVKKLILHSIPPVKLSEYYPYLRELQLNLPTGSHIPSEFGMGLTKLNTLRLGGAYRINENAFRGCSELKTVVGLGQTIALSEGCFAETGLTRLRVGGNLEKLDRFAFSAGQIESAEVRANPKFVLEGGVLCDKESGEVCLCLAKESELRFPAAVRFLKKGDVCNLKELKSIRISHLDALEAGCFQDCPNLQSIGIDSLSYFEEKAFVPFVDKTVSIPYLGKDENDDRSFVYAFGEGGPKKLRLSQQKILKTGLQSCQNLVWLVLPEIERIEGDDCFYNSHFAALDLGKRKEGLTIVGHPFCHKYELTITMHAALKSHLDSIDPDWCILHESSFLFFKRKKRAKFNLIY